MSIFLIFFIAYMSCIALTVICFFFAIGFEISFFETLGIVFMMATFIAGLGCIVGLVIWLIGIF